jgi:hypothetical protein
LTQTADGGRGMQLHPEDPTSPSFVFSSITALAVPVCKIDLSCDIVTSSFIDSSGGFGLCTEIVRMVKRHTHRRGLLREAQHILLILLLSVSLDYPFIPDMLRLFSIQNMSIKLDCELYIFYSRQTHTHKAGLPSGLSLRSSQSDKHL